MNCTPYLNLSRRSLEQAKADRAAGTDSRRLTGMEIAALPFSNTEVLSERVEERNCVGCGLPKWPSTTKLCLACRSVQS